MTHLLGNLRTYAAAVVLVGGAILAQGVLGPTWARDLAVVVAVAGAIATPPPASTHLEDTTGRRGE